MNIESINYQKPLPQVGSKEHDRALREKTDEFEAIFIKMVLDESMKDEKNLFSVNDPGEKIFKSMFREELANASSGGFGFSQMLFDYLSERNS